MSLDVYLKVPDTVAGTETDKIFIRENGSTKEISRAEWDERYPGREPVTLRSASDSEGYSDNITHNLGRMADAAGLYKVLWRPEEQGWTKAHQLIEPLRAGIAELDANPTKYKQYNPSNGWGDYNGLLMFAVNYLESCEKWPDADVEVSR